MIIRKESQRRDYDIANKTEFCKCGSSKGVYSVESEWGYWLHCADCEKKIEDEFHYYNEPDDVY